MRKITVFNYMSIDGFFAGPHGEIDWFKVRTDDDEFERYTHGQSQEGSTLIFGRTTYEMMKNYWPTQDARDSDPSMARNVNESPKIVFSKTLQDSQEGPHWKNIRIFHQIQKEEVLRLKKQEDRDFTILGSGTIIQQFANLGFIDEYDLVVVPVVLGAGKALFKDIKKMNLTLLKERSFRNGIVLLTSRPD
jgi:dihydrofolate reductase